MRIYAIGDIHGQIDMLHAAHARIEADKKRVGDPDALIVHLGDYTDRGPDSAAVVQLLIDGLAEGKPWIVLRGNHDRMFCRFVRNGDAFDNDHILSGKSWLNKSLGGKETLASYGVEATDFEFEAGWEAARKGVPMAHIEFLENCPMSYEFDGCLYVHAGVRPGVALEDQSEEDLLWIRNGWLDYEGELPWLVIHGHTALEEATHFGNRVDLDTGAGYGRPLTAAVIENGEVEILTDDGRKPITRAEPRS
ncbi:Bis(5'-nucleosyl)-tetraphosphatase PrpE [asymmetrical] [Aquimixticola soesokkakensis]|uniref:Bis(5'-nucleosyl)-tetraphosphatase PrpE [asymmetrical] n=1 Tax=Aquimixticola soesokkakensis TaxID=1519096 RepID=A0A1Y5RDE3_9RHOB|nr:metallophosphoesterase [Aquimixticola soesokkakensis]SLN14882.1 Bis(5'-nucleosyl)-tetraphosphatase PrpE [asymmetrical] [Aquimixticola soesokkakensis]